MSILAHLLREYQEQYTDLDTEQYDPTEDDNTDHNDEVVDQVVDSKKVHKIKQTFSVDQGNTKLDTTVMIRVAAENENDAKRIADQQLSKLAAYMRDIDLNDREDSDSRERDFGSVRERADNLWQGRR